MLESLGWLGCTLPLMFRYASGLQAVARFSFEDTAIIGTHSGAIERDIKIFRAGTFTDMHGRKRTWTHDDLDRAVENFRVLRDANVIPNVPVRADHTFSVKDVGGYIIDVRREGDFLLGDVEFTDPDMHAKYRNKTYRNRSIEIGQYVTNQGDTYNPVVLGLAFVDLPSVEGLYHLSISSGDTMIGKNTPAKHQADNQTPDKTTDNGDNGDDGESEGTETPPTPPPAPTPTPDAPPPTPDAPSAHSRPVVQTFRLYGHPVADPAAVQVHIDTLEQFRTEQIESTRVAFVDDLASRRVITNPQAEQFRMLVKTMDGDQFQTFKAGFDGADASNLFARHDTGNGTSDHTDPRADRISVLEGVVANFRSLGKSEEEISKLGSYRELQQLKTQN